MISYRKSQYKSHIYLLPLLFSSTITCMELITITEPTYIKSLKRKRDDFIKKLTTKYHSTIGTIYDPTVTYFYPIYNVGPQEDICERVTRNNSPLLPLLKDARREGYSALGMVVMADKISTTKKRKTINKLSPLGFTPTPQDKKAAFLEWLKYIPYNNMVLFYYAAKHNLGIIPKLPDELITLITLITVDQKKPLL